jgi:hypothetical protein
LNRSTELLTLGFEMVLPRIVGPGTFAVAAVGESNYQVALETVCGGRTEEGERGRFVEATLVPDDENPYDPNAVRVDVDGHTVGYIKAEGAVHYRQEFLRQFKQLRPATCNAVIRGGWMRGSGGSYGIWLDLPKSPTSRPRTATGCRGIPVNASRSTQFLRSTQL